jgi:hypothetical protein
VSKNFVFEGNLPRSQSRRLIIEDKIVPFLPKTPNT